MEVDGWKWGAAALLDPLSCHNGLGCTLVMVVESVDAQTPVGMVVYMVLEYGGGPMDP